MNISEFERTKPRETYKSITDSIKKYKKIIESKHPPMERRIYRRSSENKKQFNRRKIMGQLNANTPYIQCYIRNKYIFGPEDEGLTEGYIFGCKSMINRPMHFHFQCEFGAIFWMMPISAFCDGKDYDKLSDDEQTRLSLLQTWDCQSNNIAVTTFGFLQNKKVDVLCRDHKWRSGKVI
jgi:hypothetical protein